MENLAQNSILVVASIAFVALMINFEVNYFNKGSVKAEITPNEKMMAFDVIPLNSDPKAGAFAIFVPSSSSHNKYLISCDGGQTKFLIDTSIASGKRVKDSRDFPNMISYEDGTPIKEGIRAIVSQVGNRKRLEIAFSGSKDFVCDSSNYAVPTSFVLADAQKGTMLKLNKKDLNPGSGHLISPNSTQDTYSCTDSDHGVDKFTSGTVLYKVIPAQGVAGPPGRFEDKCDGDMLFEYACNDLTGQKIGPIKIDCTQGTACACDEGACIQRTCSDTDSGIDEWHKGTVSGACGKSQYTPQIDTCNGDTLREYYCNENNSLDYKEIKCANGCIDGECKPDRTCTCNDTDEGSDPSVQGIITYQGHNELNSELIIKHQDHCKDNLTLVEYYCSGIKEISCQYGCFDGRCLLETEQAGTGTFPTEYSCSDTDNRNYTQKGTLTAYYYDNYHSQGIGYLHIQANDRCIDNRTLREFYCVASDSWWGYEDILCQGACSEGKCTETTDGGSQGT